MASAKNVAYRIASRQRKMPHGRYLFFVRYRKAKPPRKATIDEVYEKKQRLVAEARDAQEALTELWRLEQDPSWMMRSAKLVIVDAAAGRGKIAPVVNKADLQALAARGL
jgi:hypothetical protein